MKKILAFILALAMIFTMGTAVFADETATPAPTQDPSKGSITVYNPTVGHQYDAYKLFDLTQNGDKVAYTYTRTDADSEGKYPETPTDVLFNKLNENASPFSLTATTVPGTYNVTKKDKSVITPATETEPEEAIIWTDEKVIEWLKGLFTYEEQVEKEISYQNPAKAYTMTFEVDPQTHETKEFTVWNDKDNKWYKEEVDAQGATKLEKFTPSQTQLDNKQPVMQDLVPPEYGYATPVATHTATDNKPFTFMNLDLGYYFVTSSLGAAVTINSTLPNVTVIDKNENDDWDYPPTEPGQPNVGKAIVENVKYLDCQDASHTKEEDHTAACYKTKDEFVKVNSANYGDTVRFSIGVNGKSFDTDENLVTYYWITDTLEDGFDVLDKDGDLINNLKVKIDGVELTKVDKDDLDLTSATNQYAITYSNTGSGTDSRKFEIVIPVIKATEVKDDPEDPEKVTKYKYDSRYDSNFQIEVTYEAVVNKDAVIAGDGNKNTANFYPQTMTFDPDNPYVPPKTPEDPQDPPKPPTTPEDPTYDSNNKRETVTYVYALGMLKVDEKGEKLAGAKFTITNEDGDKIYAVKQADGTYKYESDSTVTGRTDKFEVVATGNDKGELVIKGLKAGKYTVTETDAPDGYNILDKPFVIEPVLQVTYTEKITTYYDSDDVETRKVVDKVTEYYEETATDVKVVPQVVINKAGAELPQTGGMGTTIFYVIGAILALGAVVLLIARKRTTD